MSNQIRRACIRGPAALDALIRSKGLRLGTKLNVLREVLRAVVTDGAPLAVLDVIERQWRGLKISETVDGITELIVIEHQLRGQRDGDAALGNDRLREAIGAAVRDVRRRMGPRFDATKPLTYYHLRTTIPGLALRSGAYYVFEALMLPSALTVFAERTLFFSSTNLPAVQETLGRLNLSASIAELSALHERLLSREFSRGTAAANYDGIRADVRKELRYRLRMALFLRVYGPIFCRKRRSAARPLLGLAREIPRELFELMADMVCGEYLLL